MFTPLQGRAADSSWSKRGWVCAPRAFMLPSRLFRPPPSASQSPSSAECPLEVLVFLGACRFSHFSLKF